MAPIIEVHVIRSKPATENVFDSGNEGSALTIQACLSRLKVSQLDMLAKWIFLHYLSSVVSRSTTSISQSPPNGIDAAKKHRRARLPSEQEDSSRSKHLIAVATAKTNWSKMQVVVIVFVLASHGLLFRNFEPRVPADAA